MPIRNSDFNLKNENKLYFVHFNNSSSKFFFKKHRLQNVHWNHSSSISFVKKPTFSVHWISIDSIDQKVGGQMKCETICCYSIGSLLNWKPFVCEWNKNNIKTNVVITILTTNNMFTSFKFEKVLIEELRYNILNQQWCTGVWRQSKMRLVF